MKESRVKQPTAAVVAVAATLYMEDHPCRHHRRRRFILALALLVAITVAGLTFHFVTTRPDSQSVHGATDNASDVFQEGRTNCQIIYVLGVEGSIHHGLVPVIKSLAERQSDYRPGMGYDVVKGHELLRSAIFESSCIDEGSEEEGPCVERGDLSMKDPNSVQTLLGEICPDPYDFRSRHVIIEGNSFPSGREKENYRVTRQANWAMMTPEEIANSETALNHPTNLYDFYDSFGPYLDVRFVVLHRPYLETIASHPKFDGGPRMHSVVISGFIILLSRFLTSHMYSSFLDGNVPLWTIVCTDRLTSNSFQNEEELLESRASVLRYLANFLGWPVSTCPECFDNWVENKKSSSPRESFGDEITDDLLVHAKMLESIWPPRRPEDALPQQQCGLL
ncbi:hypothetical protein ACHAXA_000960 [Cyclostephanos tholiformis]|uniref:Membrane-associated protein n=1 Tax=Cyclostephanos tholiformis TaxID=382380 RepID=A0ABD3RKD4_9STRA